MSAPAAIGARSVRTPELEALLRRRLRGVATLFLLADFLSVCITALIPLPAEARHWPVLRGHALFLGLVAPAAGWLFWRRRGSLRSLRLVEAYLFGQQAAYLVWNTVQRFPERAVPDLGELRGGREVSLWLVESCALRWGVLIVLYGTCIPNSGRRCAGVAGSIALLCVGVFLALGIGNAALRPLVFSDLLVALLFWLGATVAIAVYGAHKINLLRDAVLEARQLGPYRILRRLGKGGMGEVFLAEHQLLRRPCAVKVIRPEHAGEPSALRRFEREVKAMAALTHWNVIEIYDYGHASDGTFYYAMEYLPGLSLQEMVDVHGPLPPERAVFLLRQVCAALREAHALGLVHRDIKPSNILVCTRGGIGDVAKLLDFGMVQLDLAAPAASKITAEGKILGTPLFMSPEQITNKEALDGRSDIYSLGGVAYFLLTGEPPFIRDSVAEIFAAHLRDAVVPLSKRNHRMPRDLEAVILRCLEKEPAQRYPDARALEEGLSGCICASRWTPEKAETWWREHYPNLLTAGPPAMSAT